MNDLEKKELVDLLKKLISIPSVTGTEDVRRAIDFVENWLTQEEIVYEKVSCHGVPNLIARVGTADGENTVLWNTHIDVVPIGNSFHWTYPPFQPQVENGYLYGRGASDSKSGLVAMLFALKKLRHMEFPGCVELMITGAEENGSEYGTVELLEKREQTYAASIVSEPSDMCIEIAQRGLRWLELRIHGIASHGARPHLGVNAISQAARIIETVETLNFDDKVDLFEKELQGSRISVTKIHGGFQNNIIPEDCKLVLDCRIMPGKTMETFMDTIQKTIADVIEPECHVEYSFLGGGWDPFVVDRQAQIVQTVEQACGRLASRPVVIRGKAGCTDASHIYKKGIPVVILGPGNPNESHRTNEKVELQNVYEMVDILVESTREFLSVHKNQKP